MRFVLAVLLMTGFSAFAETKTCTVSGMHCKGCKEMVEGKVCDETKYSTCNVKILDAKKKIGEVHLVMKDSAAKVDEKALGEAMEDSGYKLKECKTKKGA
jgi:copper chaperone CopZ